MMKMTEHLEGDVPLMQRTEDHPAVAVGRVLLFGCDRPEGEVNIGEVFFRDFIQFINWGDRGTFSAIQSLRAVGRSFQGFPILKERARCPNWLRAGGGWA